MRGSMRNGAGMIRLKRVYESPVTKDGFRVRSETTVFEVDAAHDIRHNSTSVLKRIIEEKLKSS